MLQTGAMSNFSCFFFCLLHFFILFHIGAKSETAEIITETKSLVRIGAVFDPETLEGAIAETSINLAISDFYAIHPNYQTRLHVHFTRPKDLVGTTAAAVDLLKNFQVHAIIGPQISAAAPILVELGEKTQVPILSFFETSPTISPTENPYFIRVAQNDSFQVKAISAVVQKSSWHEVVLLYEDTYYSSGFISYLVDALQEANIRVAHMINIPNSAEDFQISKELMKLMTMQTRVFIVHMNTALASRLFVLATKNGMMSKGYAWLITAGLSNSLNVLHSEVIDSMEGVLGVRSHIPKSKELELFDRRWKRNLLLTKLANTSVTEINISGLWAYDAIWALARAAEKIWPPTNPGFVKPNTIKGRTDFASLGVSMIGPGLRDEIMNTKFKGLSGEFYLVNGQLQSPVFEIINVIGYGRVVGYWTPQKRLTQNLDPNSKNDLKKIIWPGDSTTTPTGWAIPSLKIGVPVKLGFPEFVEQHKNGNKTTYSGFCIDVFLAALETLDKKLGFKVFHDFIGFEDETGAMAGSYDDLLHELKHRNFDAVVGDTSIVADRTDFVDFTLPYSESGWTMLVSAKNDNRNMWVFLKPWTWDLWLTVGIACIFMAIIIRIMEHNTENSEFRGSPIRQLSMIMMFPFYSFVIPQRELVAKDCSRFVLVVWLWLAFILMQSYTASLSSILTVDQLEPTINNLEKLRSKDHFVGFQRGCFVGNLLEKQLNFSSSQIKSYGTIQEFHEALSNGSKNGGVTAIFDEIPYVRVFLKTYGSEYTTAGPIYRTAGFGFAFPRESPLVSYFSKAILLIKENGTIMDEIEKKYFGEKIPSPILAPIISTESSSLRAYNFGGLFIIAGTATLLALIISENYILLRPITLTREYFSSPKGTELVAQPAIVTDSGHEDSLNTGRVNENIAAGEDEAFEANR